MQAASILEGLNPEQRQAVQATEGPLLVLAGAGSGKTRVLTHRIAYLIGACGIPSESILAVTFTNKAAGEMRERVEKLLGPEASQVWLSTFHSLCVRILRREIGHLGLSRGFAIYDKGDAHTLVKEAMRRAGLDPKQEEPRRIEWRIDQWKNAGVGPAEACDEAVDFEARRAAELYVVYQRLLVDSNALDFGDLLLRTVDLFDRFPEVLAHYRRRWQYVMVDEYQDTNRVQYRLVRQLAAEHGNLCVVGDVDQSIYGWRGADIRNILDFESDYPEATVVRLERNYRSTHAILAGASGVVENNLERRERSLFAEREGGDPIVVHAAPGDRDEAQWVVRQILSSQRAEGRPLGSFAIFYRTNAQSRLFEDELLKYNLPHVVVGGVRFYERAEVKDALAWLRFLVNPADAVSLRRIVARPARGIGKGTLERADAIARERGVNQLEGLRAFASGASGRAASSVARFVELVDALAADLPRCGVGESLARVLDRSGYLAALEREGGPESESRLENLRELLRAGEDFGRANAGLSDEDRSEVELFLDQVALVADVDFYERRDECVSLMTVHTAKGLEFPVVFVAGLEEGIFPHAGAIRDERGIEEERRLCYVAMTRAQDRLFLTWARERHRFGSRSYATPSRFLSEIPREALGGAAAVASEDAAEGRSLDYSYAQDDAPPGLEVGLRVRHPIFGPGTILAVSGAGANQKLRVRFERAGVKTLLLRFANLELG